MPSVSQVGAHLLPDIQQHSLNPSFTTTSKQFHARSESLQTTNFSFVTSEGDRVSLSSASEVNTSFGTYTFQGLANNQTVSVQAQQFNISTQKSFHLLVEGELNEQEQADIQEFLKSANNILQELTHGNTEEAANVAASLEKLDTLSQAALFFRQSTSVSLATQSTSIARQDGTRSNEHSLTQTQSNTEHASPLELILGKLREAQEHSQLDPEQLGNQFPTLVTSLIQSLKNNHENTHSAPSMLEQIQEKFLKSLLEFTGNFNNPSLADETSTDQPGPLTPAPPLNNEETHGLSLVQKTSDQPTYLDS
ncbi:MAG: hypothetical protein NPIRA04_34010 [Nitrospirales bacterium]|nr:MAG: hypothetical protein NPIRA04_34010 [Nitrospirales bacterium]